MRNAFAKEITRIGRTDERVVLLSGDIGNRLFDEFKEACPDRFYNCGVAEANMVGVAAGLAMCGLRPVCYTIAPFVTYRCIEQIRVDLCYHNLPVVIVGTGAGLSYASLGATHHSCEEMGMLRMLPSLAVLAPADSAEACASLAAALRLPGPSYIRIGKKGEPAIHSRPLGDFEVGRSLCLQQGRDVCLLSCGTVAPIVMEAVKLLADQSVFAEVWSCPSVKPLDTSLLESAFSRFPLVLTVEEHSRLGGFGGAVAEWLADQPPGKACLLRAGTDDAFFHHIGSQKDARAHFGLTPDAIAAHLLAFLSR